MWNHTVLTTTVPVHRIGHRKFSYHTGCGIILFTLVSTSPQHRQRKFSYHTGCGITLFTLVSTSLQNRHIKFSYYTGCGITLFSLPQYQSTEQDTESLVITLDVESYCSHQLVPVHRIGHRKFSYYTECGITLFSLVSTSLQNRHRKFSYHT